MESKKLTSLQIEAQSGTGGALVGRGNGRRRVAHWWVVAMEAHWRAKGQGVEWHRGRRRREERRDRENSGDGGDSGPEEHKGTVGQRQRSWK